MPEDPGAEFLLLAQSPPAPLTVTLEELGWAFGEGALERSSTWGADDSGTFFGSGAFAAVLSSNGSGLSDFSLSEQPEQVEIAVQRAIGFSGPTSFRIHLDTDEAVPLKTVWDDIFGLIEEQTGSTVKIMGFTLHEEDSGARYLRDCAPKKHFGARASNITGLLR